MRTSSFLLLFFALGACPAPKGGHEVEDLPAWATRSGKRTLRLEIVASFLARGATQPAMALIAKLREEGEKDPLLDMYQGEALYMEGFASEAERLLLVYAKHVPRDARPLRTLGLLYADNGQVDQAIETLRKATRLASEDAATWNNLGFLLLAQGRTPEAEEALQEAVARDGTHPRYRNNLGYALAANGHLPEALQAFRSVNSAAEAHANLAVALELQGNDADALKHYHKALKYDPEHEASLEAIVRLQKSPEEDP